MNVHERAAQVWSVLALAAWNRQTLTYEIVGKLTGMPARGLGQVLEPIQSYCLIKGLPPLSGIVVSKLTGLPSPGFVAAVNVPREQVRVFEHDWLAEAAPTPELLEQAVKQQPSNGILPPDVVEGGAS
ncbi:MAG TPA: hypothetical protein VF796_00545 [Humisphaera sp.]